MKLHHLQEARYHQHLHPGVQWAVDMSKKKLRNPGPRFSKDYPVSDLSQIIQDIERVQGVPLQHEAHEEQGRILNFYDAWNKELDVGYPMSIMHYEEGPKRKHSPRGSHKPSVQVVFDR